MAGLRFASAQSNPGLQFPAWHIVATLRNAHGNRLAGCSGHSALFEALWLKHKDNVFGAGHSPPHRGGWTRHQEKYREASFSGADGVVAHTETFRCARLPVSALQGASRYLLGGGATP